MKYLVVLLLFFLTPLDPAKAGDLVGQVLQGNTPVRNQPITIAGPASGQASTNASGLYAFRNLPEGEYMVTIMGRSEKVYVFKTGETQKNFRF